MKVEDELTDILLKDSVKLCRVCLAEAGEKSYSLFDFFLGSTMSYSEKIMLCTRVKVCSADNSVPSIICESCARELEAADLFRLKCEYSDSILSKFFNTAQNTSTTLQKALSEVEDGVPVDQIKEETPDMGVTFHESADLQPILSDDLSDKTSPLAPLECASDQSSSDREEFKLKIKHSKKRKKSLKTKRGNRKFEKMKTEKAEDGTDSLEATGMCCHLCQEPLQSVGQLAGHMCAAHGNQRRYECTECGYSTPRRQTLVYHVRVHTGEKPYACAQCERRFAQPSSLASHLKSHSDQMYHTCPECGKQFKHKEKYERHKSVHSSVPKFTCSICHKGLKSQDTLKSHMNRHYNIRNFSCETCGSSFVTRIELSNHAKKHSDEKKFHCTICDFRTRLKQILEKHLKRHTGERSLKCEHCAYTCFDRGELKLHARKHTREKKYSCPVCQRFFIHSSSVNKHMLRIHGLQYRVNDNVDRRVIK